MSTKLISYVGYFHLLGERIKESWTQFWVNRNAGGTSGNSSCSPTIDKETNFRLKVKEKLKKLTEQTIQRINHSSQDPNDVADFSHIYRPKTRSELMRISAAVMGIEFSYAAETAFVSPLLLNIGLRHRHMTLMWCLSPLLGFFITPILGSLSDGCRSALGRRRPFIILLSIGIILGLILVPNGKTVGLWFGDTYRKDNQSQPLKGEQIEILSDYITTTFSSFTYENTTVENETLQPTTDLMPTSRQMEEDQQISTYKLGSKFAKLETILGERKAHMNQIPLNENRKSLETLVKRGKLKKSLLAIMGRNNESFNDSIENEFDIPRAERLIAAPVPIITKMTDEESESNAIHEHPWGLIVTVIGTVLLDFDADACQSPSRAYMLDVTIPEDHARGLSTFTIMAGLGGSLGYFLGALNWENTFLGDLFGGHVRAVFTLVLFLFIGCVVTTVRSFREVPLERFWSSKPKGAKASSGNYARFEDDLDPNIPGRSYGTISNVDETSFSSVESEMPIPVPLADSTPTFREYISTIIHLPKSLQWLCLTNFFSWMSLVCYSLYFTDFVGEAVFGGDPTASPGTEKRRIYDAGVRFGCWGMSLYSLSCSIYSLTIDRLIQRFGAKRTYICGQLVYSIGMIFMGLVRQPFGVIIFSWTAGIMYATLFTMPYLLVARYHAADTFDTDMDDLVLPKSIHSDNNPDTNTARRGLGTDVAVVSSMVFLAQMTQALTLGNIVAATGTTTTIIFAAAIFAACGALASTRVLYLDL